MDKPQEVYIHSNHLKNLAECNGSLNVTIHKYNYQHEYSKSSGEYVALVKAADLEALQNQVTNLIASEAAWCKGYKELEADAKRYRELKRLAFTAQTSKTFAISQYDGMAWSAYELSPIDLDSELDYFIASKGNDDEQE